MSVDRHQLSALLHSASTSQQALLADACTFVCSCDALCCVPLLTLVTVARLSFAPGPRVAGRQGGIVFSKDDDDAAIDAMLAQLSRPLKKGTVPPSAAKLAAEAAKPKKSAASSSSSSASSASSASSTKLPLMDEDDEWFLPEAESALEQVFRRFASIPSVGAPADTPRDDLAWAIADIQSFARATNGKEFSTEELVDIQENLDHDEEGRLTCQGFLDFYHLQTSSHVRTTTHTNMHAGGIRFLLVQCKQADACFVPGVCLVPHRTLLSCAPPSSPGSRTRPGRTSRSSASTTSCSSRRRREATV